LGWGVDVADFTNDGRLDIVVVDMMAEDNFRQKTQMAGMAPDVFWDMVDAGYNHQFMRNTLQVNNGNGSFSEIAYMAGISKTDWSWAALMIDFDNDGWKDLFVTTGYRKDFRDNDLMIKINKKISEANARGEQPPTLYQMSQMPMGETPLANYMFQNNGDLTFSKVTEEFGFSKTSYSNGAAYADLDNDGDLELITNNFVDPVFIYRNNSEVVSDNNYLRVKFSPDAQGQNAKVTIVYGENLQHQEMTVSRGYQSSVEPVLHFGLGKLTKIEKVLIEWSDGSRELLVDVQANQVLTPMDP